MKVSLSWAYMGWTGLCTGDGSDLGRSFKRIPCMEVQQPAHNTPVGPNAEQEARPSCVRNLFCLVPSCLDTFFFCRNVGGNACN